MYIRRALILGVWGLAVLGIPLFAVAHLEGEVFSTEVDGKRVGMSINTAEPRAGESIRLDFSLEDVATDEPLPFSDVWVRIMHDEQTLFASGIHRPEFGRTGLVYTFPDAGTYEIPLRFQHDGETVAEATVPFEVGAVRNEGFTSDGLGQALLWGLLGLVLGALGGVAVIRARDS